MPAATRLGDSNTGHDLCPPVALTSASSDVLINGMGAGRVGDSYAVHGCKSHPDHSGTIASGSATVFINGMAAGRVGDPVSCGGSVAAGSSNVFVGDGKSTVEAIDASFQMNREILENGTSPLNDVEDVILYTPDIAANMATKQDNKNDALAWSELSTMLKKWEQGNKYEINDADVKNGSAELYNTALTVEWGRTYDRFEEAYQDLIANSLDEKGRPQLVDILRRTEIWRDGGSFDFSAAKPKDWERWYYNHRKVKRAFPVDGMTAALADHTIRVLPVGSIEVLSDGSRRITVNEIYAYIQDRFNFEDNEWIIFSPLGFWSKKELNFESLMVPVLTSYKFLTNNDFNEFRDKFKKGGDFVVLSPLYKCQEFSKHIFVFSEDD